jgi:hypothetical protein
MPLVSRVANLNPGWDYAVMARAHAHEAQERHIIHLENGQTDVATSSRDIDLAIERITSVLNKQV